MYTCNLMKSGFAEVFGSIFSLFWSDLLIISLKMQFNLDNLFFFSFFFLKIDLQIAWWVRCNAADRSLKMFLLD